MTNNVMVIKSGVWTIKLNRTNVISLTCTPWKISLKKCARKNNNNQNNPTSGNVRFLSRQKMSHLFPLNIFGRVWGQKPTGRTWAHRTETEIPTKASFSLLFVLCRHSYLLHLSTVFQSINSPDNSLLSHSVLPSILSILFYRSFQVCISLRKSPSPLI